MISDKCLAFDYHNLSFEIDTSQSSVAETVGYLVCECGATSENIRVDMFVDSALDVKISEIEYKEEQDELRAIDDDRIGASLK